MMIVATTHDPHLKSLAMTDTRILNASMEFNEDTHRPTYRMVLGVPGRSRALDRVPGDPQGCPGSRAMHAFRPGISMLSA